MQAFTYLIYIIAWEAMTIGSAIYAVFALHRSPWWIVVGMILSGFAYSPKSWNELNKKSDK